MNRAAVKIRPTAAANVRAINTHPVPGIRVEGEGPGPPDPRPENSEITGRSGKIEHFYR
jgi:hypothetical protein